MCVDANASARNAARQRWMEKDAKFKSESLKFFNREAQAVRGMQRIGTGFSRAISNDYQRARYVQGQAFAALEKGYSAYLGNKENVKALEGGMSRTAGRKSMLALLRAQGKLENAVEQEFGAQMDRRFRANVLRMQNAQAKVIQQRGVRPEYGAPVLMPPSDRLSGALSIASQVMSIGSTPLTPGGTSLFGKIFDL